MNNIWYTQGFGRFLPNVRGLPDVIVAVQCELGAYAVIGSAMVIAAKRWIPWRVAIPVAVILVTAMEIVGMYVIKCVVYSNGWNFLWTWIAYVGGFSIVSLYYLLLERQRPVV